MLPEQNGWDEQEVSSHPVASVFVGRPVRAPARVGRCPRTVRFQPCRDADRPRWSGKDGIATALSTTLERAFRDGRWFVELGAQRSSDTVAEKVVTSFGLGAVPGIVAEEQLRRYVRDRSMLLVLDNCEHVLPGCRRLVSALLNVSTELRVLATSREPLRIRGERVIVVRPLAIPPSDRDITVDELRKYPAAAMLEARAKAASDEFEITEGEVSSVAKLCARLDGMPLAIELAAVRLRSLSIHDLLARIDDRFALLNIGDPTAAPHHHSLDALVRWSYDLCSPYEQLLWERLAVFSGGADLAAIEAVCGFAPLAGTRLLNALDSLVSKSILLTETTQGEMRYRLLETLQEFARERASGSADQARARRAHMDYYHTWAIRAAENFFGPGQGDFIRRVESDFANLELAFDNLLEDPARSRDALTLAWSLRFFWMNGHLREGRRWLEGALALDSPACAERGNALSAAGWIASLHGDLASARNFLDESGEIARAIDDASIAAHTATWKGLTALLAADNEAARAHLEAAYRDHAARSDNEGLLMTLFLLGFARNILGDPQGSQDACREAVERSERLGETWGRFYAVWMLAYRAWSRQELDAAEELAEQSLELHHDYHDNYGSVVVINLMAGIALDQDNPEKAAKLLGIVATLLAIVDAEFLGALGTRYARVLAAARDQLGADAFDRNYEVGRRMDPAQRMRLALGRTTTVEPDRLTTPTGADLLTPREREVAALLTDGLSNRAIAAKLVLSQRTVEAHVEHILAKLGFRSRTEVGLWASKALPTSGVEV